MVSLYLVNPVDQLVPESRRGPVLHRVARGLGDHVVLAAVEADELVAEEQGGFGAVHATADILKLQTELLGDAQQPFEVRCAKAEHAAVDAALGGDELRVAFPIRIVALRFLPGRGVEDDADLVGKDLFRRTHAFQSVGVERLLKLGYQKLIREHGELHDESHQLLVALPAVLEPRRVGVVGDDGMLEQLGIDACLKLEKASGFLHGVAFPALGDGAQTRVGEPVEGVIAGEAVQLWVGCKAHDWIPRD